MVGRMFSLSLCLCLSLSLSLSVSVLLSALIPSQGILLYGPSGCGKTAIATRIAYETRHEFKFLSVSCAELIHKVRYLFPLSFLLDHHCRLLENLKNAFQSYSRLVTSLT
jgi:DNA replication protein DnaC